MLRTRQREKLRKMLQPEEIPFKILLIDPATRDILSAVLKVSDLRECGVTVHLLVAAPRAQARDVPALYFVSEQTLREGLLASDFQRDLYAAYYINAAGSIPRAVLEQLAQDASEQRIAKKVRGVADMFISFVALQEDLFTLNIAQSFVNREECAATAVVGLLSLFATLGEAPVIAGDCAGIAKQLGRKIKSTGLLKPRVKKPLLILVDRDFDLFAPVAHSTAYIELVNDLFSLHANKVEYSSGGEQKVHDIDADDAFYRKNAFEEFPVVAERVDQELLAYKKELAVRSIGEGSDKAAVKRAMENLPHLQKKSDVVNTHLALCMRILEIVRERKLDEFCHMEQAFDSAEIAGLAESGSDMDILRLCLTMVRGANSDLVDAILEKRRISSPLVEVFKSRVEAVGLRERMKSFIFKQKASALCTLVEETLAEIRRGGEDTGVFDPFNGGVVQSEVSQIVVYVHGGATYGELRALKELEKSVKIPIVLGGSEILNAEGFIAQAEQVYS
ncbi:sec1 family domain-containing protein 1 [Pancytospora philotis]|nr:sec1 family domain-containing protein 1 [Pancytospora philotis]